MNSPMLPPSIEAFWNRFQNSVELDATARFYESFHFDDNENDADELSQLVLAGTKRATASLLWTYENQQKPLPFVGALSVVTSWQGKPLCVIESTVVETVPYSDVTEQFAATEGEGDGSLAYWRRVHWLYFGRECERLGRTPSEAMPVVCEQFSVIFTDS